MKLLNGKMIVAALATFLFVGTATAQSNLERAIEFHDANMFETAKAYLLKEVAQNPSARAYYQLGDTYLMLGQADSASISFAKCDELEPGYTLDDVGKAKIKLRENNAAGAAEIITALAKKEKKNPELLTAIAEAYATYGKNTEAVEMVTAALKAKKGYAQAFITEGDLLFSQKKYNEALAKYEQALYFDKNNKGAMLRNAKTYIYVNKDLALELLNKIISADPGYIPAYIELADYYYNEADYNKAIEYYEKTAGLPALPMIDRQNYAAALYFTKQNDQSLQRAAQILKEDPNNFVMKRIQMYNNFDKENVDAAYEQAGKFFQSTGENVKYIAIDYVVYGKLLETKNELVKAAEMYEKAIELDSTRVPMYKDIAVTFEKAGDFPNAITYYTKYIDKSPEHNAFDYYTLGRIYYRASNNAAKNEDAEGQMSYLDGAEKMFDKLIAEGQDSYVGYLWKANTLYSKDPEFKGSAAKDAYELALEKCIAENKDGSRVKEISDCCKYLAQYYVHNEDNKKAVEYLKKLLEFDPNNEQMKEIVKSLEK